MASTPPLRKLTAAFRFCAVLGLVLALAGCRMDVNVGIDIAEDGSGTVNVAVGVDDDLLARVPGAVDHVHLDDLTQAGWKVTGPTKEADGNTWVHLSRPFANPAEMKEILGEINGPGGPLGTFDLVISEEWDKTTWTLTGSAGLTDGVAGFVDPALAEAFGTSKPLDQLVEESGVPDRAGTQPHDHREPPSPEGAVRRPRAARRTSGAHQGRDRERRPRRPGGGDRRGGLRRAARRAGSRTGRRRECCG